MQNNHLGYRVHSLDFMRGMIMVLLMLESAGLFHFLNASLEGSPLQLISMQFFHHPWHGLRFWDLIQPGFMFMAGIAMTYSLEKQRKAGLSWSFSFIKTLKRSGWLFFWGVLDYAVRPEGLSFELWDVLTQLSITTLIAFLIYRWNSNSQLLFSIGLLIITECLYRFTHISGFDQPFTDQKNYGNFIDLILMHKINKGGWVAINCIPTAAHTVWGVLAGKLLLSDLDAKKKIRNIILTALLFLLVGYGLDLSITPIIKRIATSSFVFVSGGYCLLFLALAYWWIDLKMHHKYIYFFEVVGTNSIFVYLFIEIIGDRWFTAYIHSIGNGLLMPIFTTTNIVGVLNAVIVFILEWKICSFLYKKKIFFKI